MQWYSIDASARLIWCAVELGKLKTKQQIREFNYRSGDIIIKNVDFDKKEYELYQIKGGFREIMAPNEYMLEGKYGTNTFAWK